MSLMEKKSSNKIPSTNTTPAALKTKGLVDSRGNQVIPQIEILKVEYSTPKKKSFILKDHVQVLLTNLTPTPTPIVSPWFMHQDDQTHCTTLINNLNNFPVESSEKWLHQKFCQFKKFVEYNDLIRVKILTNMWLADGKQHSFPVKTQKNNYLPSANAWIEKDVEYETLN